MAQPSYRIVNDTKGVALTGSPHVRNIPSQAVISSTGTVYCSGQLHMDATGKLTAGSTGEKTAQCLRNLQRVLENAGSGIDAVMKVNICLQDMQDFAEVNAEYAKWFTGDKKPARSCVAVKQLPRGGQVEIECVAQVVSPARAKL